MFLLVACPLLLTAQKNITRQQLIWYSFFNTLQFNDQWSLLTDVQERHYIKPVAQHQLVMRTALHRALPQGWDVSAGMCVFLQDPNNPEAVVRLRVPELRPHLQVVHRKQYRRLTVIHRYRAEARFFHNVNNDRTELADGYDFGNFRFRYQLQLQIPLWKISEKTSLQLRVNDELMINAGSNITRNVFDQNRLYAALLMNITPDLGVEVGYMKWFQQLPSGVDFFDRNILRFSFHHCFRFNKKDKGES